MQELKECSEEFEENYEELEELLNQIKGFDPNDIEKITNFFADLWIVLGNMQSNIGEINEAGGRLWRRYISPDDEVAYRYKISASGVPAEIDHQAESLKPLNYSKLKDEVINLNKNVRVFIPISDGYLVNDENRGLVVFNEDLTFRKLIHISEEFIINRWFYYKKFSADEFIFYIPDEYQITYVDVKTGNHRNIEFKGTWETFVPQLCHAWKNDYLIIMNKRNKIFYIIDPEKGIMKQVTKDLIEKNYPDFYNYALDAFNYDIVRAYPKSYSFIFRDYESKEIGLRNLKTDTTKTMKFFDPEVHDIRFHKDYFMFVQEKKIVIRKNKIKRVVIPAPSHYDFYDAVFVEEKR